MKPFLVVALLASVLGCLGCAGAFLLMRGAPQQATALATPSVPGLVPPPAEVVTRKSFMSFVEGRPNECLDIEATDPAGSSMNKGYLEVFVRGLPADVTPIQVTCRAQFPNRPVFASCTIDADRTIDAGVHVRLIVRSAYFDYQTLKNSTYAQNCVETRGVWTELPTDDHDVRRAEIETLQRQAEALQRSVGRSR